MTTGAARPAAPIFAPGAALAALGLSFRLETEEDIPFIRRLYCEMRWEELAVVRDWTDEQKIGFLAQQYEAQRHHYARAYFDAEFLVIERAGEPIGRLYLYRGHPTDIRIVDIGLLIAARSQGLGRAIIESVFDEARAGGRTVSIHVEVFNPARRLYDRLGFVEQGEHGPYRLMRWHG
ncbi:GNAT family N-acetyltransferase [Azospirillum sp. RWY-5-1]|uniref:GNAT family N-acetyltransferase n=1 Tax=Azospirillum oleiclasticum TaxID=2735135 RepID=A0ABX2TL14_9PROT|nr:GNAT family N-acetyltransferase [Azospirillum oleiclasticum]NYZ16456.1 GNAT family N-acetyltransferase [Azospirillum oleiclasticum]NYZ23828.1 GNAT family N-acetyltransferase [Azospirillum oleiclasticum]